MCKHCRSILTKRLCITLFKKVSCVRKKRECFEIYSRFQLGKEEITMKREREREREGAGAWIHSGHIFPISELLFSENFSLSLSLLSLLLFLSSFSTRLFFFHLLFMSECKILSFSFHLSSNLFSQAVQHLYSWKITEINLFPDFAFLFSSFRLFPILIILLPLFLGMIVLGEKIDGTISSFQVTQNCVWVIPLSLSLSLGQSVFVRRKNLLEEEWMEGTRRKKMCGGTDWVQASSVSGNHLEELLERVKEFTSSTLRYHRCSLYESSLNRSSLSFTSSSKNSFSSKVVLFKRHFFQSPNSLLPNFFLERLSSFLWTRRGDIRPTFLTCLDINNPSETVSFIFWPLFSLLQCPSSC